MTSDYELQKLAFAKLEETYQKAEEFYGRKFARYKLIFKSGIRSYIGQIRYRKRIIILNMDALRQNVKDMLEDTIPHEVAHQINLIIYGKSGHGPAWKRVMRECFGLMNPKSCTDFNYDLGERKRRRRFAYDCESCGKNFVVGIVRHNKEQKFQVKGNGYYRCQCKGKLKFKVEVR